MSSPSPPPDSPQADAPPPEDPAPPPEDPAPPEAPSESPPVAPLEAAAAQPLSAAAADDIPTGEIQPFTYSRATTPPPPTTRDNSDFQEPPRKKQATIGRVQYFSDSILFTTPDVTGPDVTVIEESFINNIPKLHPLEDGMSVAWTAKADEHTFVIKLHKTLAIFDKKFEMGVSYIGFEFPERKSLMQVMEFKDVNSEPTVDWHGLPFIIRYNPKMSIGEFLKDVNFRILEVTKRIKPIKTFSSPYVMYAKDSKFKILSGRLDNDNMLVLNHKPPYSKGILSDDDNVAAHTLDFFDFKQKSKRTYESCTKKFSALSHIFVYANIAAMSWVNGERRPLIAVISQHQKRSSHYVPVRLERFSEIKIKLADEHFEPIPPTVEKIYILLHFREVKP